MKYTLTGAAMLVSLASPAFAQTAWQGDLFITQVSNPAKCAAVGIQEGGFARAVLRAGFAGGSSDALALYFPNATVLINPTGPINGKLDGATKATQHTLTDVASLTALINGNISGVNITPPAPQPGDADVGVTFALPSIFTRGGTPSGCTPTFKGTLAKRPK